MMNNNKTIFLIGLPGSGKSVLSKLLAEKLNYALYDTDLFIEKKENKTVTDIFAYNGEDYFRNIESEILEELSSLNNAVISTGGGIVLYKKNREIMKKNGLTIFIDRDPNIILMNINTKERPLLSKDKNKLLELSKQRDSLYREASHIVFEYNIWEDNIEDTFKKFYDFIKEYKI